MEVLKTSLSSIDVRRSLFDNGAESATIFLENYKVTDKSEATDTNININGNNNI